MIIKKGTLIMYKDETSLKEDISQVPYFNILIYLVKFKSFKFVQYSTSNNPAHAQIRLRSQHSHIMFVLTPIL